MLGNTKLLSLLFNKKFCGHADVFCKHNKFYLVNQWENITPRLTSFGVSLK